MLKIGITGGIGSGKSVVSNLFRILGVPVFEADKAGKEILDDDPEVKGSLRDLFGPGIFNENGFVDRKKLAAIIFSDEKALKEVNSIIHPAVRKYFSAWCDQQKGPYIIHEAAILFESGFYRMMDYNILITADRETRISRVMERDAVSAAEVEKRISKQWDDKIKASLADVVIDNNNELLIPKVLEIDKQLKEYGKIW